MREGVKMNAPSGATCVSQLISISDAHWTSSSITVSLPTSATEIKSFIISTRGVTILGILGIPLVNLTGCEIRFVFWLLRASGRVEPYKRAKSDDPKIFMVDQMWIWVTGFSMTFSSPAFRRDGVSRFEIYLEVRD